MKQFFLILFFGVVFCLVAFSGFAQESLRQLSLDDFIRAAARYDTNFESILIDQLEFQYKKALTIPPRDLVLSVVSEYRCVLENDDDASVNEVSLEKLFPYTGTEITASYASSMKQTSHEISSQYSVVMTQPIAKNAFGKATRLLDQIVGIEIDVATHQIVEAYEDYLAVLIQRYFDWYAAYENLKTAENAYRENVRLLENIKARQENSIALPLDVNKIQLQVLLKEENLVALRNRCSQIRRRIEEVIRYTDEPVLVPVLPSLYQPRMIDFERELRRFQEQNRTHQLLALLEDKSSLEIEKYADALLPSIELIAGFSLFGKDHDVVPEEKQAYGGLRLDFPFPGETEQAEYELARIDYQQTLVSSSTIRARLITDLKNLYETIEQEQKLIVLSDKKIALAEAIVEDETENYSYGKTSLKDLIDEVNKLEDNKFVKISHSVQLRKLIVEWLRFTDQLVKSKDLSSGLEIEDIGVLSRTAER